MYIFFSFYVANNVSYLKILIIRESFNSHNSAFNEENDSWYEFEKKVVCLIFESLVRISFNSSGELGRVKFLYLQYRGF